MKYQVGDRVLLLHSNEEGEIIDIINEKMLMIDVEGVKFPVYTDQVDFPYFKRFTEKKLFPAKKEKKYVDDLRKEKTAAIPPRVEDGVWVTILPIMDSDEFGDDVVDELKLHLVNRTNATYSFTYRLSYFGKPEFDLKNDIHPFEDFYLHDIPFESLNDNPSFFFEFSLVPAQKKKATSVGYSIKLKPKQLFATIEEITKKNEATFSIKLFDQYPDKSVEEPIGLGGSAGKSNLLYKAEKARQHMEPPRSTVDLHIEKLKDDWKHLSNYEILSFQLKTFEKYYDLAVAHMQPSLVVIHGVGEGRLRDEIHDMLRLKKEVKSFVNQYHPLYGYGATEIYFQY